MPLKLNFIEDEHCQIHDTVTDSHGVLSRYKYSLNQLVNLCGGIPSLTINSIRLIAKSVSEHVIEVWIETNLYHVSRRINFRTGSIANELMRVYEPEQCVGTALFLTQVREARLKGFVKIETTALAPDSLDQWDGYYRWARVGYQMDDRNDIDDLEELLRFFSRRERSLSELVSSDEGYAFWKENGFTWTGEFYLAENSISMEHLNNYLVQKGIDFTP